MEEQNKKIINSLVGESNFGYLELENLSEDIVEYVNMCKKAGHLVRLKEVV
jgi:hypothetical protein